MYNLCGFQILSFQVMWTPELVARQTKGKQSSDSVQYRYIGRALPANKDIIFKIKKINFSCFLRYKKKKKIGARIVINYTRTQGGTHVHTL